MATWERRPTKHAAFIHLPLPRRPPAKGLPSFPSLACAALINLTANVGLVLRNVHLGGSNLGGSGADSAVVSLDDVSLFYRLTSTSYYVHSVITVFHHRKLANTLSL